MLPGPWMAFPAWFFCSISPLSLCYRIKLRSNNPQSLILLVHTADVPFRARLRQPQASYRLDGKEGKHQRTKPHAFCKESQHVPCALREAGSPGGVQKAEPLPEE